MSNTRDGVAKAVAPYLPVASAAMTDGTDQMTELVGLAQRQTHALEQIRGAVFVLLSLAALAGVIWVFVLLT